MRRALILACVIAVLAASAGLQTWRLNQWRDAAQAAEAKNRAWAEAARIRKEADRRLEQIRRDAASIDHDLNTMEGGDAPLDPYLRDAARRLWGP